MTTYSKFHFPCILFLRARVEAITWHIDSHGLFDYEEKERVTLSSFNHFTNCKSISLFYHFLVLIKRDGEKLKSEIFQNFSTMQSSYKLLQEQVGKSDISKPSATCLFKDNKFWIYHSNLIENIEEEKANPSDKLWLVLRHMAND